MVNLFRYQKSSIALVLLILASGCATNNSHGPSGILSVMNPENTCRNYHTFFIGKHDKYSCKQIYDNGGFYVGEFVGDQRHGFGSYKWPSGATFEGVWFRDEMDNGTYTFPNGDKHEGNFRNGVPHGQGRRLDATGAVTAEGLFESGRYVSEIEVNMRKEAKALREKAEAAAEEERKARVRAAQMRRDSEERERVAREKIQMDTEARARAAREQLERERVAREGDGSSHDLLCKKYGLRPATPQYVECRTQLEAHERQQAEERRIYDQRLAEYRREQERRRGEAMFLFGMGMLANSGRSAAPPVMPMPQPPAMQNFNLFIQGMPPINCRSNLNIVDCR